MLDQGANDYNRGMARSAFYGHESIVQLRLERGANNYNETMINAARTDHEAIVRLMLENGANVYNRAMVMAANGHLSIVMLMPDRVAKNYGYAMMNAAAEGHDSIVELMIDRMTRLSVMFHGASSLTSSVFNIMMDCLTEEVRLEAPWNMIFADDVVLSQKQKRKLKSSWKARGEHWRTEN